jgi:hypothetical protein
MADPASCVVLVPYLTYIEAACERGLRALEARGYEVRRVASSAAIDRTRCELATQALSEGYDELMWIDSDIGFEPESVELLRGHEAPLIGGLYPKRGVADFACHFEAGTTELRVGETGGVLAVRYVGTGFLLTRRVVYEDIQRTFALPECNVRFGAPAVPYFLPMVIAEPEGGHWYLGEDFAFCERARTSGHKVLVDSRIRLGHIGKYVYGWEDAGGALTRVSSGTFSFGPKRG